MATEALNVPVKEIAHVVALMLNPVGKAGEIVQLLMVAALVVIVGVTVDKVLPMVAVMGE